MSKTVFDNKRRKAFRMNPALIAARQADLFSQPVAEAGTIALIPTRQADLFTVADKSILIPTRPADSLAASPAELLNLTLKGQPAVSTSSHQPSPPDGEMPVLTGNYEVTVPGGPIAGRIMFAETLAEAAQLLADHMSGKPRSRASYLALLEGAAKLGLLSPGGRGTHFHQGEGEKVTFARVKPGRERQPPRFRVGQEVYTDGLEGQASRLKTGTIRSIIVTDHGSEDRQYVYGIGSYSFRENRLTAEKATDDQHLSL